MLMSKIRYRLTYVILTFFILFSLCFVTLYCWEEQLRAYQLNEIKSSEMSLLSLESAYFQNEINAALSDLRYLSSVYSKELLEQTSYQSVEKEWLLFARHRTYYDQIRFIDHTGKEKINIKSIEDGPIILPEIHLENKSERFYFSETAKLKEGTLYVSTLDLSIENKEIESPITPVIRFSTPVYDNNNTFRGIIILNYSAESLLHGFAKISENSSGEMILLNRNGYWTPHTTGENEWRFDFESLETTQLTLDKEIDLYLNNASQTLSQSRLLSFYKVDLISDTPHVEFEENAWYLFSQILPTPNNERIFMNRPILLAKYLIKTHRLMFVFILSGAFIIACLMYFNRKTYEKMKYYSDVDPLTKAYNRYSGMNQLNRRFPLNERRQYTASLCFIDINGLKLVNDKLGHKYGDELIVTVSHVILSHIREGDFIMRFGGDEFLILFNETDKTEAEAAWERIVSAFIAINKSEKRPYNISVSHGIISFSNENHLPFDELIKLADAEMYLEKKILKSTVEILKERV